MRAHPLQPSGGQATEAEAIVVGGGLAGSAAAITLARSGREVVLLERASQPHHKVCGEFLSGEALGYLSRLGVDVASLGAVPIHRVRVAGRRGVAAAELPFAAMSLTRCRLDEALLGQARAVGVTVLRGSSVSSLYASGNGWCADRDSGATMSARTVFLATGKHDLRGYNRPPGPQNDLVAFKMYWKLAPAQAAALAGYVELLLFRGGYAGLQPVEGGVANLCWVVRRDELRRLGSDWKALLSAMREACPHLDGRLDSAAPLLERPLAVSSIPYGWLRAAAPQPGLWPLGDQAAVIPSFTGDGMSIALHSGCLAAGSYLGGGSAAEFQSALSRSLRRQVGLATAVSRALVEDSAQPLLVAAMRFWPGVLRLLAANTRIPASARLV